MNAIFLKILILHHLLVKWNHRAYSLYRKFIERAAHAGDCLLARIAPHNQFANHRIVMNGDCVALIDMAVDTHERASGGDEAHNLARAWEESLGVFGCDAAFNRMPAKVD